MLCDVLKLHTKVLHDGPQPREVKQVVKAVMLAAGRLNVRREVKLHEDTLREHSAVKRDNTGASNQRLGRLSVCNMLAARGKDPHARARKKNVAHLHVRILRGANPAHGLHHGCLWNQRLALTLHNGIPSLRRLCHKLQHLLSKLPTPQPQPNRPHGHKRTNESPQ
jgi:hypothetical protein